MPYPLSKLLKEKFNPELKLTSDGNAFLTEMLNKLDKKLSKTGKNNYLDSLQNLMGEVSSKFDETARKNAQDSVTFKTVSQATTELKLVFPVRKTKGGDLGRSVFCATVLETVATSVLNQARADSVNNKVGKAQMILAISFVKASTMDGTVSNMSPLAQLAWKLGYMAPRATDKQLMNPKYTDYGMQCILASKGFQAVKEKFDKEGVRVGDSGLSYSDCMTVLLFRKRGGCSKDYQTRNLLTGRCEGKKPCKSYQTRDENGRCVGANPSPTKKRKTRKSKRKSVKKSKCKRGVRKSGGCKRKPGRKRKSVKKSKCKRGVRKSGGCKRKPGPKRK